MTKLKALNTKLRNLDKRSYQRLLFLSSVSKDLYNQTNYLVLQYWKYTGSYLNYNQMDLIMKERINLESEINYKKLKAGVSQQILKKLDKNYKSFFKSIKDWKNSKNKYLGVPQPPKYIKEKYYNLIYDFQRFQVKNSYIQLEKDLQIPIPNQLKNQTIKQIEVIPKYKHFEVVFVYIDKEEYKQIEQNDNVLSIDLGLNNLATCTSNKNEPFVINGKPLKAVNQYFNKKFGKYKSSLEKRNQKKWSKKLDLLTQKRNRKINDYLHKATRKITNICVKNNIGKVVVGDVKNSLSNINIGKRNNQNFVNISLGQFVNKLKYKLENHSIECVVVDESYTSKASFLDNDVLPKKHNKELKYEFSGKRIQRGLYKSKNSIMINADVNGAYNILRKAVPNFNVNTLFDGIEGDFIRNRWLYPHKLTV